NRLDVASGHHARTLLAHNHALRALALHGDGDFLDVQDDVSHVLTNAGDRRELMQHAVNLHSLDGRALKRRQQDATKRIAKRQAKTPLERLGDDSSKTTGIAAGRDLKLVRLDQLLPVLLDGHEPLPFRSSPPWEK